MEKKKKKDGERNYKKVTVHVSKRWHDFGKLVTTERLYPGLKIFHIGQDVWKIGKSSYAKNPNKDNKSMLHQVIYGPDRKEYHLWGNEVTAISDSYCVRHGNSAIEHKVKIHVLTSILDDRNNWCFDLNCKPNVDDKVKVIYNNGTVKNIIFSGEWEKVLKNKYANDDEKTKKRLMDADYSFCSMTPIGYRIKNN